MLTVAGKNQLMDNMGGTWISAHTGFPGENGANEAAGGSYARVQGTFAAAVNGQRSLSAPVVLAVPAGTYQFIGRWSAQNAGTLLQVGALNGVNRRFSLDVSTNFLRLIAHGWANGQKVTFLNGTPPAGTGVALGAILYVVGQTTDTFQLALTEGGAAIDFTAQAGEGGIITAITPEVFANAGNLTVSSFISGANG